MDPDSCSGVKRLIRSLRLPQRADRGAEAAARSDAPHPAPRLVEAPLLVPAARQVCGDLAHLREIGGLREARAAQAARGAWAHDLRALEREMAAVEREAEPELRGGLSVPRPEDYPTALRRRVQARLEGACVSRHFDGDVNDRGTRLRQVRWVGHGTSA